MLKPRSQLKQVALLPMTSNAKFQNVLECATKYSEAGWELADAILAAVPQRTQGQGYDGPSVRAELEALSAYLMENGRLFSATTLSGYRSIAALCPPETRVKDGTMTLHIRLRRPELVREYVKLGETINRTNITAFLRAKRKKPIPTRTSSGPIATQLSRLADLATINGEEAEKLLLNNKRLSNRSLAKLAQRAADTWQRIANRL